MLAVHGGLLGVYDEVAEAVVAVELLHGVVDLSVAVAVHVGARLDVQSEEMEDALKVVSTGRSASPAPGAHRAYKGFTRCRLRQNI